VCRAAAINRIALGLLRAMDNVREYARMAGEATEREAELIATWRDLQRQRNFVAPVLAQSALETQIEGCRQVLAASQCSLQYKKKILRQHGHSSGATSALVDGLNDDNSDTDESSSDLCPICRGPPSNVSVTPCGHVFCRACLDGHFIRGGQVCPSCRRRITPGSISHVGTTSAGLEVSAIAPWDPCSGLSECDSLRSMFAVSAGTLQLANARK